MSRFRTDNDLLTIIAAFNMFLVRLYRDSPSEYLPTKQKWDLKNKKLNGNLEESKTMDYKSESW